MVSGVGTQMFEGLIEFIEQSVFTLVNQLAERESDPAARSRKLDREREPHVAEADHADVGVMRGDARLQILEPTHVLPPAAPSLLARTRK